MPINAMQRLFGQGEPSQDNQTLTHSVVVAAARKRVENDVKGAVDEGPSQSIDVAHEMLGDRKLDTRSNNYRDSGNPRDTANPYHLLDSDADQSQPSELTADTHSPKRLPKRSRRSRVMMPEWDDVSGFWHFYGNKLQVNNIEERAFHLC